MLQRLFFLMYDWCDGFCVFAGCGEDSIWRFHPTLVVTIGLLCVVESEILAKVRHRVDTELTNSLAVWHEKIVNATKCCGFVVKMDEF